MNSITKIIILIVVVVVGFYFLPGVLNNDEPIVIDDGSNTTVFECKPEQRNIDACIEIYQPVCAEVQVQCITTPCPPIKETFSNSCKACSNSLVSTYTEGECAI